MANYTKEISHMLERYFIKILHQDKGGFYKDDLNVKLSLVELLLLRQLQANGERKLSDLLEYLEIDRNLLATTIKKLQSLNYIVKKPDHIDGSGQVVMLSNYGEQFIMTLEKSMKAEMDFVLRDITINEEKAILKFLSKMVQYHTTKFELEQLESNKNK